MTDRGVGGPLEHTYLVTASAHELATLAVPAVRRSLTAGDAVHVNLAPGRQAAVRAGLGSDADQVSWSDTTAWAPHAARRLRAIERIVDREVASGARRLWFLGECAWDRREPECFGEWERFDTALNVALAGRPVTLVCVYDASELPAEVVERAAASHPLRGLDARDPCPRYVEPAALLAGRRPDRLPAPASAVRLVGPLVPGRARAQLVSYLAQELGERPDPAGRATTSGGSARTGTDDAVDALLVAATELVTNSWRAGAATVEMACWRDGPWALVQVDDDGPGLADPLAGYRRPPADAPDGRGLWIVRQLADGMDLATGDWGTSVRLRFRVPDPPPSEIAR